MPPLSESQASELLINHSPNPTYVILICKLKDYAFGTRNNLTELIESIRNLKPRILCSLSLDRSNAIDNNDQASSSSSSTLHSSKSEEIFSPGFLERPTESQRIQSRTKEILVRYNISEVTTKSLQRALRCTAHNNHPKSMQHLIKHESIDVNAHDDNPESKRTALHHAACANSLACVTLLLQAGANTNICDAKGLTAYDYAKSQGNIELIDQLQPSESSKTLHPHITH